MSKLTAIISAFPGCGKSTAFNDLKKKINILDSDSSTFDKSDFPNNYIKHIKENIGIADIIFISSHETVRKALQKEGIHYSIYYPSKHRKSEFLELYKQRGNDDNFIKMLDKNFDNFIDSIENEKYHEVNKIKLINEGEFIGNDEMFMSLIKTYNVMKTYERNIIVTGGCGFIGSHLIRLLVNKYPNYRIINVDKLTYCGNLDNLKDVEDKENYEFHEIDICDAFLLNSLFEHYNVDGVIHLAAESHVDNSIKDPFIFVKTNVLGTVTLLQVAKEFWLQKEEKYENKMFYHVSTDEVYGALEMDESKTEQPYGDTFFKETDKYFPHSPYSASKASSDHFVRAYHDTYGLPVVISNCSNNYGGYQYPEKLIPLIFSNIINEKPLPIYGKGENVRDWLYVEDHVKAIDLIFHKGKVGETYNIGGFNEWKNIDIVKLIINILDEWLGKPKGYSEKLITYVTDRAGHDLRYAIDSSKLQSELGWKPTVTFEEGIRMTLKWYLENLEWLYKIKNKKNE